MTTISIQLPAAVAASIVPATFGGYDPYSGGNLGGLLSESKARPGRGGGGGAGNKVAAGKTLGILSGIMTRMITKSSSTKEAGTPELWAAYKAQDMKAFAKAFPKFVDKLIANLKVVAAEHAKKMKEAPATAGAAGYDTAYSNAATAALTALCSGNDIPLFVGDECAVAEAGARWFAMNVALMQSIASASKAENSYALQAIFNENWGGLSKWLNAKSKEIFAHVEKVMGFDMKDLKSDGTARKTAAERKPRQQSEASKDRAHEKRMATINAKRVAAGMEALPVTARKRRVAKDDSSDTKTEAPAANSVTSVAEQPARRARSSSRSAETKKETKKVAKAEVPAGGTF